MRRNHPVKRSHKEERRKHELHSTYFVEDRHNKEEIARLTIQDEMITRSMGGVLPEQSDPASFQRAFDVACGTGGWAIEAARAYPTMSLAGIDISKTVIAHAQERAHAEQLAERVSFHIMDALGTLDFAPASFDLVNMRLGVSFVRTWDWPRLLNELYRVTTPEGVIRLTEADIGESSSPALTRLAQQLRQAFYNAGNLFRLQDDGLTSELAPLLIRFGLANVQMREHMLIYHAGSPEGQLFAKDMQHIYRTLRHFLERWTRMPADYDATYQQALIEMQQADFVANWRFVTAWGYHG